MNKDHKIIKDKYLDLQKQLQDPAIVSNPDNYKKISQEFAEYKDVYTQIEKLENIETGIKEAELSLKNKEFKELAQEELERLAITKEKTENEILLFLKPKDPNDKKDVIIEIRAGAGGDESALFAADLYRMYSRYAENKKWKTKLLSANRTGIGGFKEVIFEITGQNVYGIMKYESGVHRVQRVPETEKSGRVHTSTATVAVLPEAEEVELKINANDLRIDTFCAGGHGGQSVNTTYSAVRITHIPTNIAVSCQDERSQLQNKERAMQILRSRLLAFEQEKKAQKIGADRKSQVGTGMRAEKIRTYNIPQDRITDHRIKKNWNSIQLILDGDLDQIINILKDSELS
jgi:peptide chain release factor 1